MFVDTHMHEMTCSKDSFLKLEEMVEIAREKGLGAICITDHDDMGLKEYAEEYAEKGFCIVLIDAPVLFESGFDKFCEKNICVTADEETRIRRITERDGISPEDAKRRILSQTPVNIAEEKADYVIINNGDDNALDREIKACTDELKKLYERRKEAI